VACVATHKYECCRCFGCAASIFLALIAARHRLRATKKRGEQPETELPGNVLTCPCPTVFYYSTAGLLSKCHLDRNGLIRVRANTLKLLCYNSNSNKLDVSMFGIGSHKPLISWLRVICPLPLIHLHLHCCWPVGLSTTSSGMRWKSLAINCNQ